jgi:hypothetical protein
MEVFSMKPIYPKNAKKKMSVPRGPRNNPPRTMFSLRLQTALHDELLKLAEKSGRSVSYHLHKALSAGLGL